MASGTWTLYNRAFELAKEFDEKMAKFTESNLEDDLLAEEGDILEGKGELPKENIFELPVVEIPPYYSSQNLPMTEQPFVGQIVHYLANTSKKGSTPVCRAAIITSLSGTFVSGQSLGHANLAVFMPSGLYFVTNRMYSKTASKEFTWHFISDCKG